MKNVILVDYDVNDGWDFQKALEYSTNKKWEIKKIICNKNHGNMYQTVIRYMKYFVFSLEVFLKRNKYETVLAWQQFFGIILAFYCRVFRVKKAPSIYIMTFIYKKKGKIFGWVYEKFVRYAINSEYVKKCIVFSKSEKEYYQEYFGKSELFVNTKLGIEDKISYMSDNIKINGYYLSAGRSNRDYSFLENAWQYNDKILKIICDTYSGKQEVKNVVYLKKCYDLQFFFELSNCKAVIISLENEHISSGQLVILQAMMHGKPVIVTKNDTVIEYIEHLKTGLVINKTKEDLKWAIDWIDYPQNQKYISHNARKHFEQNFSIYAMGTRIGNLIYKEC